MENKPTVLIVEDDKPIRNFITVSLDLENYHCIEATSGKEAITLIASHRPDVIVLDLGLPDMDGIEVIRKVREWCKSKIIVVSARGQERDKIGALDAGADDYLTKPFGMGELLARIRVALRQGSQSGQEAAQNGVFEVRGLTIDFIKRRVFVSGQEIHLTPNEYHILKLLAQHPGKVLTHHFILKEVWGSYTESDTKSLRVFMANIRRKIEQDSTKPQYIVTEVGVGYRLLDE
ncbi:MAG: response regulator [Cellulosilyticaceae bacterium]